jgi:outer membrane protein assembly factor BamB
MRNNFITTTSLLQLLLLSAASTLSAVGANWPAWRGPDGNGVSREKNLPLHWSTNESIRWSISLPGPGNSTPAVWGKRVFVTQSLTKEQRRTVMCFDRRDGKLLWQAGPTWTEKDSGGSANPPCSPSPVTDGKRVIAWFGSAGVFCWDMDGRELWRSDLGKQTHGWGYASSPILHRDLCVLNFGPGQRSFLVTLDKRTGKIIWQKDLPGISADAKWEDFGGDLAYWKKLGSPTMPEVTGSTSTPLVAHAKGGDEIIVTVPLRAMSFAPKTGDLLWTCDGLSTGALSSPLFDEGVVVAPSSGLRNALMTIRPGGRGDVTATHRLWYLNPPSSKSCIGSGVVHKGHIYQITSMGFAQCLDLKTGQTVWDERLTGSGSKNSSWSSFVLAGDRLYVSNQNADVFVLRAGPTFERLAINSLGGEPMNASLAVSDGDIFIRTDRHLWCVADKEAK